MKTWHKVALIYVAGGVLTALYLNQRHGQNTFQGLWAPSVLWPAYLPAALWETYQNGQASQ